MLRLQINKNFLPVIALMSGMLLSACESETEYFATEDAVYYQAEENLEVTFETVNEIAKAAIQYADARYTSRITESDLLACADVTITGTESLGKIEIDFGTKGCGAADGKTRRGRIVVDYNGKRMYYGSVIYATLEDFYLGSVKVEGKLKSENITGKGEKPTYRVSLINGKTINPDGTYTHWDSERIHTVNFSGDSENLEIEVTGSSRGRTMTTKTFSSEIVEPLIYQSECAGSGMHTPVRGIKKIKTDRDSEVLIDYGSGDCDKRFTVTVDGKSREQAL